MNTPRKVIDIRKKLRSSELGRIRYNNLMRHTVLLEALYFLGMLIVLFTSECVVFSSSPLDIFTFPSLIALGMFAASIIVIVANILSVFRNDRDFSRKKRWVNIAEMFFYSGAFLLGVSFLLYEVLPNGLSAYAEGSWPGGVILYLIIPLLAMLSYLSVARKNELSYYDSFMITEIILLFFCVSCVCAEIFDFDNSAAHAFTDISRLPVNILLIVASVSVLWFFNRIAVKATEINKQHMIEFGWKHSEERTTPVRVVLSDARLRQIAYLIFNLFLIYAAAYTAYTSWKAMPPFGWSATPSFFSIVLGISALLSIPYNIHGIHVKSNSVFPNWYSYFICGRVIGGIALFVIGLIGVLVSSGGESAFKVEWGGSLLTYIVIPVITLVMCFWEPKRFTMKELLISSLPFSLCVILSKIFIVGFHMESKLPLEMSYFFDGIQFYICVLAPQLLVPTVYALAYINEDDERFRAEGVVVEREEDSKIHFYVCGTRNGVAPTSRDYHEFGQASNCYVLRDGNYGMVLGCGCGLVSAPEKLKGCSHVDVLLPDTTFSTLMGLLAVPNICPGAKVRILGPFGNGRNFVNMRQFAIPPLWPVYVIVGDCISARPDVDIPLNNMYSVRFTPANPKATRYMIRISGAVSVAFTGTIGAVTECGVDWAKDADLLIYDSSAGVAAGCEFAEKAEAGLLLMANHNPLRTDEALAVEEEQAVSLFPNAEYARQGTEYEMI